MSWSVDELITSRDPFILLKICKKNNYYSDLYNDNNSLLWQKILSYYYKKYENYKKKLLDFKDYYVFLYYCEKFNLIENYNLIERGQKLMILLPKIYDGDIIAIIHAISNIAVIGNYCNIVMYRDLLEKNIPIYGNGYLVIQYLNSPRDLYLKKKEVPNYEYSEFVHPLFGGYNRFIN